MIALEREEGVDLGPEGAVYSSAGASVVTDWMILFSGIGHQSGWQPCGAFREAVHALGKWGRRWQRGEEKAGGWRN